MISNRQANTENGFYSFVPFSKYYENQLSTLFSISINSDQYPSQKFIFSIIMPMKCQYWNGKLVSSLIIITK